ncbi:hypothetical protein Hanom_Chr15g01389121 [Helianthus anomalus]
MYFVLVDNFGLVGYVFSIKIENLCMDFRLLLLISIIWFLDLFMFTTVLILQKFKNKIHNYKKNGHIKL